MYFRESGLFFGGVIISLDRDAKGRRYRGNAFDRKGFAVSRQANCMTQREVLSTEEAP